MDNAKLVQSLGGMSPQQSQAAIKMIGSALMQKQRQEALADYRQRQLNLQQQRQKALADYHQRQLDIQKQKQEDTADYYQDQLDLREQKQNTLANYYQDQIDIRERQEDRLQRTAKFERQMTNKKWKIDKKIKRLDAWLKNVQAAESRAKLDLAIQEREELIRKRERLTDLENKLKTKTVQTTAGEMNLADAWKAKEAGVPGIEIIGDPEHIESYKDEKSGKVYGVFTNPGGGVDEPVKVKEMPKLEGTRKATSRTVEKLSTRKEATETTVGKSIGDIRTSDWYDSQLEGFFSQNPTLKGALDYPDDKRHMEAVNEFRDYMLENIRNVLKEDDVLMAEDPETGRRGYFRIKDDGSYEFIRSLPYD